MHKKKRLTSRKTKQKLEKNKCMAQFENALFSSKFYAWCHCLINLNMHGHNIKEHAQFGK